VKILLIEDHTPLRQQLENLLAQQGYVCETAANYPQAAAKSEVYVYDLLLVDINLPGGGSGLDIIRRVKKEHPHTAIIVISARDATNHKIEGLELGADDYITKPFDVSELLARVKSVLRRYAFDGRAEVTYGNITIDTQRQVVLVDDAEVDLTKTEYKLLLFFFSNAGRVLTREGMAEHVWGDHMDLADSFDFIYSHMKNLRKKLKHAGAMDLIKVVYGVGYKLEKP